MKKKMVSILMMVCMFATMISMSLAAESLSLTIQCEKDGDVISGMEWNIYKAAEKNSDGEYVLVGDFADYRISFGDGSVSALSAAASTLASYVIADDIEAGQTGVSNEEGKIVFTALVSGELTDGVYLAMAKPFVDGELKYTAEPMLLELNSSSAETANIVAYPKISTEYSEGEEKEYSVTKIWENDGENVIFPEFITVNIYCDGELYSTVNLAENNSWTYSWTASSEHEWSVTEAVVPNNFEVIIRSQDGAFVVVNSFKDTDTSITPTPTPTPGEDGPTPTTGVDKPTPTPDGETDLTPTPTPPEKLPQTGQLWWPLPLLIIGGRMTAQACNAYFITMKS